MFQFKRIEKSIFDVVFRILTKPDSFAMENGFSNLADIRPELSSLICCGHPHNQAAYVDY
jgi:hypothetical protein